MLDNLEERAGRALAAIPRRATARKPTRRGRNCGDGCIHSLGLQHLPWPPDLRPRLVGTLARADYRIEKIVYQTLPDLQVPAHLYVPTA